MAIEEDVGSSVERTRRRARELAETGRETAEEIGDMAKERIKDLIDTTNEQIKKVQAATRESPGTALTIAFITGMTIGGVLALLALSRRKD